MQITIIIIYVLDYQHLMTKKLNRGILSGFLMFQNRPFIWSGAQHVTNTPLLLPPLNIWLIINFLFWKKCRLKFDCLSFQMFFLKELNPELIQTLFRLYSCQTLYVPLRANVWLHSGCYFLLLYSCLLGILLTFIFATNFITFDWTTSKRLSTSMSFEFQTSDVSRVLALHVGFR